MGEVDTTTDAVCSALDTWSNGGPANQIADLLRTVTLT